MKSSSCVGGGLVIVALGLLVVLIGCFAVPYELPKQKTDYLIIDNKDSAQYKDWAGNYDTKNNYQMVFYFYNLTNGDSVRQHASVPNYTIAGPYVYRRHRRALNVEFLENGAKAQFLDFRDYVYDQDASQGRSNQDYVSNVNPVYFSALQQAGAELYMLVAASGGYLTNITNYFTGPFVSVYTSFIIPDYLPKVIDEKIAAINATVNNNESAMDIFLNVWCNFTTDSPVGGNWDGLLLSKHFNVSTNISVASTQLLLDPSKNFSLVNTDPISAWAWDRAINSTYYSDLIGDAMELTKEQIDAIWYWRTESFGPVFMYNEVIANYSLGNISDIGWVQWAQGLDILGGTPEAPISIYDLFPIEEIGYFFYVELWVTSVNNDPVVFFPLDKLQVLNSTTGLGNLTVYQNLILAENGGATDFSAWGLTTDEASLIFNYALGLGTSQVAPALKQVFGPSGGLILNQTIDDWVFNCNPFLANLLIPDPPSCNLLNNHSVFANVTIYTGKGNISQINEYADWQGGPVVSGIWGNDLPVGGCTELGQFAPNQKKGGYLYTFNDEFVRKMPLQYNTTSSVQKIDTYQYVLNYSDVFSTNDFYFQTIPGFTNMTNVYYSLWDMLYVDEAIKNLTNITGTPPNLTEAICNTVIDVEPITGNTLRAYKRLQANVYTPPVCSWCSPGFLSPFGNKDVRLRIDALKYGPRVGLIVGIVLGVLFVIIGVAMVLYGRGRKYDDGYKSID